MGKLTRGQRYQMVQMYEDGFKCEYIAALFGVRREYPSKLAIRWGSPKRRPKYGPRGPRGSGKMEAT
jgi:hypothetical protein